MEPNTIKCSDALTYVQSLPDNSVNCMITSPPYYGLRDYDTDGQIGLEDTPEAFIKRLVELFRECRRALRDDGVLWINIGDSYANDTKWGGNSSGKHVKDLHGNTSIGRGKKVTGLPPKSLMMIPARLALALQKDGWVLRSDAPWIKRNAMPESVKDRATNAHEHIFMFTKSQRYWFDVNAVRRPQSGTAHSRGKGSARKQGEDGTTNRNNPSWNTSVTKYVDMPGSRSLRTTDFYFDSIDARIEELRRELLELEMLRDGQGVLTGADDVIGSFIINTASNSLAHFATFPEALVKPIVLSSCPPTVCIRCGAPHVRIVEKEAMSAPDWTAYGGKNQTENDQASHKRLGGNVKRFRAAGMDQNNPFPQPITIGWRATCGCNAETQPGLVIDIFAGTGTTCAVALGLGRRTSGCDLNPEYVKLANQRVGESDPFQPHQVGAGIVQRSLFEGGAANSETL